jgi:hypothetical protein
MTHKASNQNKTDKKPVQQHMLLDCVSSPDGTTLYCKRIKPKNADKILHMDADSLDSTTGFKSPKTGEPEEEPIKPDFEINLASDQKTSDIELKEKCEENECEVSKDMFDTSIPTDDELKDIQNKSGTEDPGDG